MVVFRLLKPGGPVRPLLSVGKYFVPTWGLDEVWPASLQASPPGIAKARAQGGVPVESSPLRLYLRCLSQRPRCPGYSIPAIAVARLAARASPGDLLGEGSRLVNPGPALLYLAQAPVPEFARAAPVVKEIFVQIYLLPIGTLHDCWVPDGRFLLRCTC